jgi:hypothetical protein
MHLAYGPFLFRQKRHLAFCRQRWYTLVQQVTERYLALWLGPISVGMSGDGSPE